MASHPYLSTEKEWGGWFGVTLYPDVDKGNGTSTNGNIQVYVNTNAEKIDLYEGRKKETSNWAHEGYGHALFKVLGKPSNHGSIKSLKSDSPENNKELEIQINDREKEAEKNYELHK